MRNLVFFLITVFVAISAHAAKPDRIFYGAEDGSWQVPCSFSEVKPGNKDWLVRCRQGRAVEKEFLLHLLLREFSGGSSGKQAYQVLYWVFDRASGGATSDFRGSSFTVTLKSKAAMEELTLTQNVESGVTVLTTIVALP